MNLGSPPAELIQNHHTFIVQGVEDLLSGFLLLQWSDPITAERGDAHQGAWHLDTGQSGIAQVMLERGSEHYHVNQPLHVVTIICHRI